MFSLFLCAFVSASNDPLSAGLTTFVVLPVVSLKKPASKFSYFSSVIFSLVPIFSPCSFEVDVDFIAPSESTSLKAVPLFFDLLLICGLT